MFGLHTHNGISNASRSFADSSIKLKDLAKRAKEKGLKGIAVTDHETVGGFIEAKNLEESMDYSILCGNEIYAVSDFQYDSLKENYQEGMYFPHFLLLSLDEIGNRQLRELSTIAWTINGFQSRGLFRTPTKFSDIENVIGNDKGHIVASSACLGGQIPKWIADYIANPDRVESRKSQIYSFINMNKELFGENCFYLEIQPAKEKGDLQDLVNLEIVEIGRQTNTELIVTTDAHYLDRELLPLHCKFLKSSDDNEEDKDRKIEEIYGTAYLMSEEEVVKYFEDVDFDMKVLKKAIENTDKIGERAKKYSMRKTQKVPKIAKDDSWELQKNFFPNNGVFKTIVDSNNIDDIYLLYRLQQGILNNVDFIDLQETFNRLDEELTEILVISEMLKENLGNYFITMEKIIDIIWTDGDSIVGVGRGSCASSIIAFLLGIIQSNPLKMPVEMPFWRFITRSRIELPDIDIDSQSNRRNKIFNAVKKYFESLGGEVVNCCTYGTIGSKSAIQTAGRGLGLSSDVTQNISSMIPIERGVVWSLKDTYYGNEDEERYPIKEFVNAVNEVDGLFDLALLIEGVIISRGVHASGVFITNSDFSEYGSKMKSPKGIVTSQWDLHQSEQFGLLKYDFLTTKACTKIRLTMDSLIEHGHIEQKSTLRETYNSILHPHTIKYDTPKVWETIATNRMMDLFQFSTPIAMQTVSEIQPNSLIELSQSNSLMRLQQQPDALESPTETYVRFKNDINEWYEEMDNYGVPKEDQEMLASVLLPYRGVAESQEAIMILSQLEGLSKFTIAESHKLRKSIAKKSKQAYAEITDLFYKKCMENSANRKTMDYVWDVQVKRQKLYSFSTLHSIVYALIALQELVLFTEYPEVYWNCACLTVNAGAVEDSDDGEKEKTTNYGKVAKALGEVMSQNINVSLPYVNEARFGFTPDEQNNQIIFGLKGVVNINDNIAHDIINNRPYQSLQDFYERLVLEKREVIQSTGKKQMQSIVSLGATISLIKAGAFDKIENKDRVEIMTDFLKLLSPDRKSLNMQNIEGILDMGIIPAEFDFAVKTYNFRKFLTNKERFVRISKTAKSKKWYRLIGSNDSQTEYVKNFFLSNYATDLKEEDDYYYDEFGEIVILEGGSSGFTKLYNQILAPLKKWFNTKDCLSRYNDNKWNEIWSKHAEGTVSKWEMDSIGFYYHDHELTDVDTEKYGIVDFVNVFDSNDYTSEDKQEFPFSLYKGIKYPKFPLDRICGTVLDKDQNKHTISILTTSGVVLIKFYAGAFSHYDKQVSILNEDTGKKNVIEKSWFTRGNKLLITGYRRGDQFKPKVYKGDAYQHTVSLIEGVREDGVLELKTERTRID